MHRDPSISAKVSRAQELIAANPEWSLAKVAREADINRMTLKYRLEEAPPAQDGLSEEVTNAEIPVFVRDYTSLASLNVYPIGDLHIGSPLHQGKRLSEWLKYLERTAGVSMLNTGDNTNCALSSSVSDEYGELLTVQEARKAQAKAFKPLAEANKIDLMIDGNHELRVYRATGDTPNSQVADQLGINYTMSAAIVRYLVGDQQYDVYLRHGKGGGGMSGSQVNNLQKQEQIIDADIYVSGHTHSQIAFVKDVFVPNGSGGFRRKKRLFVCSGSFMGYESYAAESGYPPAHIGAPRIFLDGRKHDQHASV